jgi:hypothetical protein
MDPIANLREQRELVAQIIALIDENTRDDGTLVDDAIEEIAEAANRLAELVRALDEWRQKGGFDPYQESFALVRDVAVELRDDLRFRERNDIRDPTGRLSPVEQRALRLARMVLGEGA